MNDDHEIEVIHAYRETAEWPVECEGEFKTVIIRNTVCKMRCSCGEIFLARVFVADE